MRPHRRNQKAVLRRSYRRTAGLVARAPGWPCRGLTRAWPETLHPALQRVADFVEHLGVLDGGRHAPAFAVGDLLDGAAQDFSGARLRQPADRDRELEGCDGPELVAHQR